MEQGYNDDNGQYQDPLNYCPTCGSTLEPFSGPETGPIETWRILLTQRANGQSTRILSTGRSLV